MIQFVHLEARPHARQQIEEAQALVDDYAQRPEPRAH